MHVGDGIHSPPNGFTLFHWLIGGGNAPRKIAMCQQRLGRKPLQMFNEEGNALIAFISVQGYKQWVLVSNTECNENFCRLHGDESLFVFQYSDERWPHYQLCSVITGKAPHTTVPMGTWTLWKLRETQVGTWLLPNTTSVGVGMFPLSPNIESC